MTDRIPCNIGAAVLLVWVAVATAALGQTSLLLEDFEFASSDAQAAAGVIDLTDECNRPAFYINGDNVDCCPPENLDCCGLPGEPACCATSGASEGFYSIGTDAVFCIGFDCFPCPPGTVIGFRRVLDPPPGAPECAGGTGRVVPLVHTYGDPAHPGPLPADFSIAQLELLVDAYGDGAFEGGDQATHLLINLVDCEGEIFEFVNYHEPALISNLWTDGIRMGRDLIRISPQSLIDVPGGDRLLTEVAAIEALIRDDRDPPTTVGKWYVDYLRVQEPPMPGDFTGDGHVNLSDFATLATCFGVVVSNPPPSCPASDAQAVDLNGDGVVNLTDFGSFALLFGR